MTNSGIGVSIFQRLPDGLLVGLAGAVRGRGKGDQFEPRMVFEQRHEALSDHARSSENANLNLFGHNNLSLMLERFSKFCKFDFAYA